MTNPFPFTAGDVLNAADLNAIGDLQTFTPTWNNVTLGASGTAVGRYAQIQNVVFYKASFDLGGTGSVTGHVNMALPVGTGDSSTTYAIAAQAWVRPAGTAIYQAIGYQAAAQVFLYALDTAGNRAGVQNVDATDPATWTSNGSAYLAGWYFTT